MVRAQTISLILTPYIYIYEVLTPYTYTYDVLTPYKCSHMVRAQTISPILTPYICIHIHIHTKFCRSTHAATRIARGVHYMHSDTLRIRICIYTYMCNSAALLIQPIRRPPHTDRTRIRDLPPSTYTSAALHTQIARESDDFLYSLRNTYVILTPYIYAHGSRAEHMMNSDALHTCV